MALVTPVWMGWSEAEKGEEREVEDVQGTMTEEVGAIGYHSVLGKLLARSRRCPFVDNT